MQARTPIVALAVLLGVSGCSSLRSQIEATVVRPAKNARITLRVEDRPFLDVVETIRKKAGVKIIIDDGIDETVSIDLEQVEQGQQGEVSKSSYQLHVA